MGNSPTPVSVVEPGYKTTEFWVTTVTGVTVAAFGLLAAFGLNVNDTQRLAILALEGVALPGLAAAYALARSIRKHGQ